jgi:stage IV sporulation protein FB
MDRNYWQLGRWRRIPVAMHWTVLLSFVWIYLFFWNLLATLIAAAAFLLLLVAHEFGHVATLRRKKIPIFGIRLYGIHGEVEHGYASKAQSIQVAWAGVGAQFGVLLLALALTYLTAGVSNPVLSVILGPVLFVFTRLNLLLMIIALLPIGPFDGHDAWAAIPYVRGLLRKRRKARQAREKKMREREVLLDDALSAERLQELEESSARAAAELIERLAKKADNREDKR